MSPSGDDVRRQLDRLLASTVFANAGRMSRFLKFVVEQTLAGEGDRLKEYVIGIEVFDRDSSYDPRLDSIVRVEAARLRSKLAEYYAGEGCGDALVLSLPKGGYAPMATLGHKSAAANGAPPTNGTAAIPGVQPEHAPQSARSMRWLWAFGGVFAIGAATAAVVAWSPGMTPAPDLRVAVLPFTVGTAGTNAETFAQQLTEGVTAELVRAGHFTVVASSAARAVSSTTQRPREAAAALDADVLVSARVQADGDSVRVETYAVGGKLEEKLWVESFAGSVGDSDGLEREIAAAIGAALGEAKVAR